MNTPEMALKAWPFVRAALEDDSLTDQLREAGRKTKAVRASAPAPTRARRAGRALAEIGTTVELLSQRAERQRRKTRIGTFGVVLAGGAIAGAAFAYGQRSATPALPQHPTSPQPETTPHA